MDRLAQTRNLLWTTLFPFFTGGCALMPTKATVRMIEHKKEREGHYSLLFRIQEPAELKGKYDAASSWRGDLAKDADGGLYEVYLNFTMVGILGSADHLFKPKDYTQAPPGSKESDFLEMAKRLN